MQLRCAAYDVAVTDVKQCHTDPHPNEAVVLEAFSTRKAGSDETEKRKSLNIRPYPESRFLG